MYYRNATAAVVVYDITREVGVNLRCPPAPAALFPSCVTTVTPLSEYHQSTFQTLQKWVQELHSMGPSNIIIAVAGNKSGASLSRASVLLKCCCVVVDLQVSIVSHIVSHPDAPRWALRSGVAATRVNRGGKGVRRADWRHLCGDERAGGRQRGVHL
jgi:hypothetical protein